MCSGMHQRDEYGALKMMRLAQAGERFSMRRSSNQSLFQSEFDDLRYAQRNDLICLYACCFSLVGWV